jgi:hypothetical protein
MKMYGGVDETLFVTSTLVGTEWPPSNSRFFNLGTHWIKNERDHSKRRIILQ